MLLLLKCFNNLAVIGNVSIKPIGNANNTPPNCPSLKCNCCCIDGMREAQDEYPKPEIKKNTPQAIRNLNLPGAVTLSIHDIKRQK